MNDGGVEMTKKLIAGVIFLGGVGVYIALYLSFLLDILNAPSGKPPNLDNANVQLATAIGGLLGGAFAVAFGIQRQDPTIDERRGNIGATLTPSAPWITIVTLLAYASVGLATLVVVRTHGAEAPQEIQASATVFAGYVAAIFAAAFTGPGQSQQPQPPVSVSAGS